MEIQYKDSDNLSFKDRIKYDLGLKLSSFGKRSSGLKTLSEEADLSTRTLRRILDDNTTPSTNTVIKIYEYLLNTNYHHELISKLPTVIREQIFSRENDIRILSDKKSYSSKVDELINTDSVFRALYLQSATGEIKRSFVSFKYGQHGAEVLDSMVSLRVLKKVKENIYTSGTLRANLRNSTIISLGKNLIDNNLTVEHLDLLGENSASIYFQAIDKETYNNILKVDLEANLKKKELLSTAKEGNVKMWSFACVDTLDEKPIYEENSIMSKEVH